MSNVDRRTNILARHVSGSPCSTTANGMANSRLSPSSTSATAHRQLPRFDATIMEHYLCDLPSLRDEVYELFKNHPELLVPCEEGLTKGKFTHSFILLFILF
jgi:hypothetical protein